MDWAARLVAASRERRPKRMSRRERVTVAAVAAAFIGVAVALAAVLPARHDADPLLIAALVVGYAWVSRVEFEVGSGYAVPDVLVLVPMLFLAPLDLVPLLVAAALVLSRVPDVLTRKIHAERALYGLADAWLPVGPVVVMSLLAAEQPSAAALPVYALALAAGFVTSVVPSLALETFGMGAHPADTFRSTLWSVRIDAVLWPVGLMAAEAALTMPTMLLAIGPLVWLLSVFSRERRERYAAALELNRAYRGTVALLSDVVESDDTYTGEHCRSVVDLVMQVADELDVDREARQELEFAALLHDVGKIAIPKDIINKPAALTDEEFELMKTHTIEGEQLLDRIGGLLGRVGRIVRSCHERWDGGGYPDGLHGTQIPLAARIVFACDAYNAMTTNRPYRQAMPVASAVAELREHSGSQFDPWVVDALVRVVERQAVAEPIPEQAMVALLAGRELAAGPAV
jgi:HD-GYP domain-containing protein (c-di-GMP phosphodiesterase class II)